MIRYLKAPSGEIIECDLAPRYWRTLDLVAAGYQNKQIASIMQLTPETVREYIFKATQSLRELTPLSKLTPFNFRVAIARMIQCSDCLLVKCPGTQNIVSISNNERKIA